MLYAAAFRLEDNANKARKITLKIIIETFLVQNDNQVYFKSLCSVYQHAVTLFLDPTARVDYSTTHGVYILKN